jgi:hypothetical protein
MQEQHLRQKYDLTLDDYSVLFSTQAGCCAICGKHQSELAERLEVDHDHMTNRVRGLLCPNCNKLLGYAFDSEESLLAAALYLHQFE